MTAIAGWDWGLVAMAQQVLAHACAKVALQGVSKSVVALGSGKRKPERSGQSGGGKVCGKAKVSWARRALKSNPTSSKAARAASLPG